ncbi:PRC-barrel domain-containing protein [Guptibacillus hwajinpoensis]|uniref:Sporulation protein YlmC with PRC-barrel domain n=1 Tax=Guptibacillus hwajinpoensis TaxID=208199 RepID=A0ABU0JVU5_9BACL|nr:PRC-barrel domain-containing protein [Alkalihalobacillus hemicentroti]MDQ0481221.1 sporulation protein YlmC with PRC-barrel domain [Alkalihalobacillus hemicentroti]
MIKVGNELIGHKLTNDSTAELSINQVYFNQTLSEVTYVEINKREASNYKDAVPDHHSSEMLHSIEASGGQFTPDNYPVTDDDRKAHDANGSMIVSYDSLSWEQGSLSLMDTEKEVQSTVLVDQNSFAVLNKAEVLTEEGKELGKVKEVVINQHGLVEGLELSEGLFTDLLKSDQPFLELNESIQFEHGKVIVPDKYVEKISK